MNLFLLAWVNMLIKCIWQRLVNLICKIWKGTNPFFFFAFSVLETLHIDRNKLIIAITILAYYLLERFFTKSVTVTMTDCKMSCFSVIVYLIDMQTEQNLTVTVFSVIFCTPPISITSNYLIFLYRSAVLWTAALASLISCKFCHSFMVLVECIVSLY
jgi:hypothetical protein